MNTIDEQQQRQQRPKLGRSIVRGISSSCDDLLEEKLETDESDTIGLIKPSESQRPSSKELEQCSPVKGSGKKGRNSRRKISMPWFRQSSFGLGLSKLRLPKQHTIAEAPNVPTVAEARINTIRSAEMLHLNVRHPYAILCSCFFNQFYLTTIYVLLFNTF